MSKETLKAQIDATFDTRRAFIARFNEAAGAECLNETTLSRQIAGRISISSGYVAAYTLFFYLEKVLRDV